ncbi:MAG: site-2 protease family protein, partial [bacterium]|nr:site-2 protease family protein [bacterium]
MVTVIIFIIVLAVLILVHEFGHFISAKKLGIRVDEFGLGFPPKLWGKKKGETEYTVNAIPFGGFVKIFGENPDDVSEKGPDSKRSFVNKPKWVQAIVLVAGVFFNFVFAWILISITFFMGVNASVTDYAKYADRITDKGVTVAMTVKDKPAYNSGLRLGDTIRSIEIYSNGKNITSSSTPLSVTIGTITVNS